MRLEFDGCLVRAGVRARQMQPWKKRVMLLLDAETMDGDIMDAKARAPRLLP
jgi:hypothetical protein